VVSLERDIFELAMVLQLREEDSVITPNELAGRDGELRYAPGSAILSTSLWIVSPKGPLTPHNRT